MSQTLAKLCHFMERIEKNSPFYQKKLQESGYKPGDIRSLEDFKRLPFTTKEELRETYPLKLQAVPEEEVVRIHSSSGTTGKPVIIPYTAGDVEAWGIMMERCMRVAGLTPRDRIQITPGYGLWTAGIGFQAGAERLGAMAIPTGPGNTDKQLQLLVDLEATALAATSSYALLLAEEIHKRGLKEQIKLKKGIIGSERWGEKMRRRIGDELGIQLYDIYGLTEIYGPGISISCQEDCGLHYWDEYLYLEIIDPKTLQPVEEGEFGELVITTLLKEGAPLLRYRTRDITRLLPGACPCGLPYPRHDRIVGRSDDMTKVKGVNIYPGQIDELLSGMEGVSSEYQVLIRHVENKDHLTLRFEQMPGYAKEDLEKTMAQLFKSKIGITIAVQGLALGELPRSEKKTVRIFDQRD